MRFLYGKPVAERIHAEIRDRVEHLSLRPGLAVVLVGDDRASHLYVSLKEKAALADGIRFEKHLFSAEAAESEIIDRIGALNEDASVHGIIVQYPLPAGFDSDRIVDMIDPEKDADGFHHENIDAFLGGDRAKIPVFPEALLEVLQSSGESCVGKKAAVVVNSEYFGHALVKACENLGMTTEIVLASEKHDRCAALLESDIILTACGIPGIIDGSCLVSGMTIIDGGIVEQDGQIVGDVDAEKAASKIRFLSPVPGGVGPVTIACLLRKVVTRAEMLSTGNASKQNS